MRYIVVLFLFMTSLAAHVRAQAVRWRQWPAPLQLFPRNDRNEATVPIAGQLSGEGYSRVSLVVYQNGQRWKSQSINVAGSPTEFTFRPTITAGLFEYRFDVFAVNGRDSLRVAQRDSILCGDVYLFAGQSNLRGYDPEGYTYRHKLLRVFGSPFSADTAWHVPDYGQYQTGLIGMEFQRLLLERYGMPTCLINGTEGGLPLRALAARTPGNPADPTNPYGALLYRAQKAGVSQHVKAMIWRQGEAEAGAGSTAGYEQQFATLLEQWRTDYVFQRRYVAQINFLPEANPGAGWLRDFQRQQRRLPATDVMATVGLPGFDGVHFKAPGQRQFAHELARIIGRDLYGATDTTDVSSPDIRRAFYRGRDSTEVVLEFSRATTMRWPNDTTLTATNGQRYVLDLRDFMYLDYNDQPTMPRVVQRGRAEGNRIILTLPKGQNAKTVTYLPNYFRPASSDQIPVYSGPFLTSSRGMRALTFYKVPLAAALPAPANVVATRVTEQQIDLRWSASAGALGYVLERAPNPDGPYQPIATLPAGQLTYSDKSIPASLGWYYYRVMALGRDADSGYSNLVETKPVVLATLVDVAQPSAYPVPARGLLHVRLPRRWQSGSVRVSLTNLQGQNVNHQSVRSEDVVTLDISQLSPGMYVLTVRSEQERYVQTILVH